MELLCSVWFQNILNKTQFSVFYFKKDPQRKNQNLNFNTSQLYKKKKKQRSGKRIKTQKRKLEAYWNLSCYWHTKDPTRQKRLLWCEGESFYWKLRAFSATKLFLKKLDKKWKKKIWHCENINERRFGNKNEKMKQKKSTRKMDIASMKAEDHKRKSSCAWFKTLVKTLVYAREGA